MKLILENGMDYFTDDSGKKVCRGAKMGRINILPESKNAPVKLRLEKLRLDNGGYDKGGAYWGFGNRIDIYCAWTPDHSVMIYQWAASRQQAKREIWALLPMARFYR